MAVLQRVREDDDEVLELSSRCYDCLVSICKTKIKEVNLASFFSVVHCSCTVMFH